MRAAIAEIMADRQHELSFSRNSSGGTYCSLLLAVTVESEEHRNAIFTGATAAPPLPHGAVGRLCRIERVVVALGRNVMPDG